VRLPVGRIIRTSRSSEIDRSLQAVDLCRTSVHAEVDGAGARAGPLGISAKLTIPLRPTKTTTTAVWPHTAIAFPGAVSQSDKLTFSGPSFHPNVQAPIATASPGLTGGAASASATGGGSETLDQRPTLFNTLQHLSYSSHGQWFNTIFRNQHSASAIFFTGRNAKAHRAV
jgi:hypothetical protein